MTVPAPVPGRDGADGGSDRTRRSPPALLELGHARALNEVGCCGFLARAIGIACEG